MRFYFQWLLASILILILSGCDADHPPSRSDILENRLDSIMADIMENEAPPGMLLAVWTPDATYLKALGVANLETGEPLATDVTYRIGSQTKMYTTTVILQMVDEGKLLLDDTISKHLDGVKGGDGITLFEMMSNTSGLASYSRNQAWQDLFFADPNLVWSPEQLISYTNDLDPLFPPGQGWDYSNTNFVILGRIAEKVDGKPLHEIFRDRLFTKLGMSTSDLPDDIYVPAPTVKGYYESGEGLTRFSDWTLQSPTWSWAAGGLISNVKDSKLWIEAAVDGGLISDDLQKERMSLWVNPANGQIGAKGGYGMGIGNMNGAIGHTGSLPGWNSGSYRLPDQQVTVVFFFNMQSEVVEPAPRLLDEVTNLIKELY